MRISVFSDSRFVSDGNGNYFTSSNMRRPWLYSLTEPFEKVLVLCRTRICDLSSFPADDVMNHSGIEFVPVPNFRGPLERMKSSVHIKRQIHYAVDQTDCCLLRFGSVLSCQASPIARRLHKPTIGQVVGDFGMEILQNPKHVPIPLLRQMVAHRSIKRNQAAFNGCDILCGVTSSIAAQYASGDREVFQLVDSCLTRDSYARPQEKASQTVRAVFAGRLMQFKNVQNFLRAVAKLKQEQITVEVVIVGDGDYAAALRQVTQDLDLSGQVEFTGRIESRKRLWDIYRSADIGFILSYSEGLPLGAIEPMSASLPIIGANLEYMHSVLDDGVEGFLVDPDSCEEIAAKLKGLATDAALRRKMGQAACQRSQQFSAEKQAEKLYQLANRLVSE